MGQKGDLDEFSRSLELSTNQSRRALKNCRMIDYYQRLNLKIKIGDRPKRLIKIKNQVKMQKNKSRRNLGF